MSHTIYLIFQNTDNYHSLNIYASHGNTCISYIGIGTVMATTCVNGVQKWITLSNVIHALNIGCHFISICKIGKRGNSTTFTNNTVTLSSNGIDYAEGHLLGQQYWLTLQAPAPSANAVQCGIPIETLHTQDLVTYSGQHCRNSVVKLIQTPNKLSQHVKGVY